jgi:hypothetical protein
MPEYRRSRIEGGTYFFTVATYEPGRSLPLQRPDRCYTLPGWMYAIAFRFKQSQFVCCLTTFIVFGLCPVVMQTIQFVGKKSNTCLQKITFHTLDLGMFAMIHGSSEEKLPFGNDGSGNIR